MKKADQRDLIAMALLQGQQAPGTMRTGGFEAGRPIDQLPVDEMIRQELLRQMQGGEPPPASMQPEPLGDYPTIPEDMYR